MSYASKFKPIFVKEIPFQDSIERGSRLISIIVRFCQRRIENSDWSNSIQQRVPSDINVRTECPK